MSFLPQFASNTATSPHPVHNNQFSRVFSGRLRRAPGSHSFSLRDQYGIRSPLGPFGSRYTQSDGSNSASYDSSSHTSLEFFEEDICPPPGFDDPKSIEEQLTDLRAIVNFIVPAGGVDPNVNHGPAFERLKFSPGDDNEVIEHFVRNAEAQDPDFKDKLAEFSNDRPDMFRGASPTDDWRKQEIDIEKRQYEFYDTERSVPQQQCANANTTQPHPAQLEEDSEYQAQFGHVEVDDANNNGDFTGDYDDDFKLVGNMKGGSSKKGSPKWQKGTGTVRRRSSFSGKSKRVTKQEKIDRGCKEDMNRSYVYLF
ncbi:hypothetical protein ONS96_006880 [Cadophora gregata f. sp. sojae]|nr:hypothetical protein ONS96_006880 [Cadophora gregata f. sp. sojae]